MSGRGLGFTGGTIDKLGAIPGFHVAMVYEDFVKQVNSTGIAVTGQTGHIAPADKKIYALRDVTGTVDNLSLITSSIMSKKLAAGSDAILLDVKCGSGAFMKTEQDARRLAELMVKIGSAAGKETVAVITDMDQPLGRAVGNALEVREAIQVLKNEGPDDITELSVKLAGTMVYLGGRASSLQEGEQKAAQALSDGSALQKFREFVAAQGGDPDITEDPGLLRFGGDIGRSESMVRRVYSRDGHDEDRPRVRSTRVQAVKRKMMRSTFRRGFICIERQANTFAKVMLYVPFMEMM